MHAPSAGSSAKSFGGLASDATERTAAQLPAAAVGGRRGRGGFTGDVRSPWLSASR